MTTPHPDPAVAQAVSTLVIPDGGDTVKLDITRSAEAAEFAGRALAAQLSHHKPEILVTWEQPDEAILAHIVARQLGLRAVLFGVYGGVIPLEAALIRNRRVGLVVTRLSQTADYDILVRFLASNAASLVVVGEVLRGTDAPRSAGTRVALAEPGQLNVS